MSGRIVRRGRAAVQYPVGVEFRTRTSLIAFSLRTGRFDASYGLHLPTRVSQGHFQVEGGLGVQPKALRAWNLECPPFTAGRPIKAGSYISRDYRNPLQ